MNRILVTGGCGYLGSLAVRELLARGHEVVVLDVLLHGQRDVAESLERDGARVIVGDVRDADDRAVALRDIDTVVHLAAIVGDPACAVDPELSTATNVDASRALLSQAAALGVDHLVFASTCSNYGIVEDDGSIVNELFELRPASLYAEQKVEIESWLLGPDRPDVAALTCLRFATLFGASPRMRFDLLVNEFARDLHAGRPVEIYGGETWRPYVHVADAARAIAASVDRPIADTDDRLVLNVGSNGANYRKREVAQLVSDIVGTGSVQEVPRGADNRSYRVAFDAIHAAYDFQPHWSVEDGINELVHLLESGAIDDPYAARFANT